MGSALGRRLAAELLGTFVLVFDGSGTAVLDADNTGIDLLGIAFGLLGDRKVSPQAA